LDNYKQFFFLKEAVHAEIDGVEAKEKCEHKRALILNSACF